LREEDLPRNIKTKNSESLYVSEYSIFYLRQKMADSDQSNKKAIGKQLDRLILSQDDFKETINSYFEQNKL